MSYIKALIDKESPEESTDPDTVSSSSSSGSGIIKDLQYGPARRTNSFFQELFPSPKIPDSAKKSPPGLSMRQSQDSQLYSSGTSESDIMSIRTHTRPGLPHLISSTRTSSIKRNPSWFREQPMFIPSAGFSSADSTITQVTSNTETLFTESRSSTKSISSRTRQASINRTASGGGESSDSQTAYSIPMIPVQLERFGQEPIKEEQEYEDLPLISNAEEVIHVGMQRTDTEHGFQNTAAASTKVHGRAASSGTHSKNDSKDDSSVKAFRSSLLANILLLPKRSSYLASKRLSDPSVEIPPLRSLSGSFQQKLKEKNPAAHSDEQSPSERSNTDESSAVDNKLPHPEPSKRKSTIMDLDRNKLDQLLQIYESAGHRKYWVDTEKSPVYGFDAKRDGDWMQYRSLFSAWRMISILLIGLLIPPLLFMIGGGSYSGVSDKTLLRIIIHKKHRENVDRGFIWNVDVKWFRRLSILVGVVELFTLLALVSTGFGIQLSG
ncbi:Bud8p Ecym_6143 [Eremothecium cymbalariae DBVPG|uniref:Uncharacterized protein n=1 Tax=Eremothecium cymbalariae (strain CBS 270.75 / DBVPG 7215 / KCTC 17166 / NRRL Y-17582) TaxID=931890 RepID=G8JV55_ERECY|nr:hypothetical protein Ecym_6143 [Eremothecium cymbalariae DBVPG\